MSEQVTVHRLFRFSFTGKDPTTEGTETSTDHRHSRSAGTGRRRPRWARRVVPVWVTASMYLLCRGSALFGCSTG
jgi:hypothetical protein